jgi:inositol hexakisphosphate/diphosphoinositol-pentakisphosphate kinase
VRRNANGKEIRYAIPLTDEEFKIAKSVSRIFKQAICGFDLLRTDGKSFVIDVNGWSFVKGNEFYYEQCARILKRMFLDSSRAKGEILELGSTTEQWKLKGFFSVMRHGDRTPKQKLKVCFDR